MGLWRAVPYRTLFIIYPSAAHQDGFIGTTLRYFDPKSGTWSVTSVDPENAAVQILTGGAVGDDRIVLLSENTDDKESRWSFDDIAPIHGSFAMRHPATAARPGGCGKKIT